jgi:hypothetical protein
MRTGKIGLKNYLCIYNVPTLPFVTAEKKNKQYSIYYSTAQATQSYKKKSNLAKSQAKKALTPLTI